jgi:crotonobetainyl-CoA:carnitine CoA-transferase CaiB-like acyl-CoA transferase
MITAGAAASQVLADFGADVIKVESPTRFDGFRQWTQVSGGAGADKDINRSPPFRSVNRNKRAIAIDLKAREGRDLFLRLAAVSDVVLENFRRGVMERLGIGFKDLQAVNHKIVLVSLSSQGPDGPESGYISYGSSLEASGGLMSVTGFSKPVWTGGNMNYPDQTVSVAAPGMVIAGLLQRDQTGEAVHVEVPQREIVTSLLGEVVLRASMTGQVQGLHGNRDPDFVPQGVYPTHGADRWIAITVSSDAEWAALCEVLELELDGPWDFEQRQAEHDWIDKAIAARARTWDGAKLAQQLQDRGIAACPVLRPDEVAQQDQLTAVNGRTRLPDDEYWHRGFLARFSRTPGEQRRRAPRLGEHTTEVLAELLGLTTAEIYELERAHVVFTDGKAGNDSSVSRPSKSTASDAPTSSITGTRNEVRP